MTAEDPKVVENKLTNKTKYLTTAAIFMECITFGVALSFYPPVLVDLKNKYGTDIQTISWIFITLTVGYLIGAFAGGILFTRVIKRQFGVVLAFTGIAASLFLTPYCPSILLLFLNGSLLGFCCGAYDTAQIVWMLEIWQSQAGPFIQAQHFCFAIGSNIPIFLVTPFLGQSNYQTEETYELEELTEEPSGLKIPFAIGACFALFNICYEIFLITCYRYEKPPPEIKSIPSDQMKNGICTPDDVEKALKEDKKDSNIYRIKLIIVSGLFMGFCVGMETSSIQFIPTLAHYGDLKLSEAEGAMVLSGLTGAFTFGRAIGILITLKVKPQYILFMNLLFLVGGNVSLLFWANSSYEMLWAGCILLGLGLSTMYASFYTFMSNHLVFTDQIGSLMLCCGSFVGTVYPLIVGKYIERNPVVITYTNFLSIGACTSVFIIAYFITSRHTKQIKHVSS